MVPIRWKIEAWARPEVGMKPLPPDTPGVAVPLAVEATVTVVVPEVGLAMVPNSRARVAVSAAGVTMFAVAVVLAEIGAAEAAVAAAMLAVAAARAMRNFMEIPLLNLVCAKRVVVDPAKEYCSTIPLRGEIRVIQRSVVAGQILISCYPILALRPCYLTVNAERLCVKRCN